MAKKYRVCFRLPDGRRGESFCQTKHEAELTKSMVNALIASVNSGIVNQDALQWASKLPQSYYDKLVRWGLLTERTVGVTLAKLVAFIAEQQKSPKVKYANDNVGRRLISVFGAHRDISTISRADAESFTRLLAKSVNSKNGKPIKDSTARTMLQRVKYMFNEAVRVGWLDVSPFMSTSIKADVDKSDWCYISKQEVLSVLDNVHNPELRAMIALYRFAGIRGKSELTEMTWSPETIRWSSTDSQCSISITSPKLKHTTARHWRTVPLPPFVERYLSEWFAVCPEGRKMFGVGMGMGRAADNVVKAFRDNGIDIHRAYNLRRSFCCDMMEAVGAADAAMYESLCGHSFEVGMKHYQLLHYNRRQTGEQKVMDFWSRPETTTPFTTPNPAESEGIRGNLKTSQDGNSAENVGNSGIF